MEKSQKNKVVNQFAHVVLKKDVTGEIYVLDVYEDENRANTRVAMERNYSDEDVWYQSANFFRNEV